MISRSLITAALLGISAAAGAQSIELNLNDESAELRYFSAMGQQGFGQGEWDMGLIYMEEDNDTLFSGGVQVVGPAGAGLPGTTVGVGVRGYLSAGTDEDIAGLGVGGQLAYTPPAFDRLSFGVQAIYAPDILTFMDADHLFEVNARVGYAVLPTALVYAGYRKIETEFDEAGDVSLIEGGHIGVKFSF